MGITDDKEQKPFTMEDVANRELVIKMLKYEDSIILGEIGKQIYKNDLYNPRKTLSPEYAIHRLVLARFDFDTTESSVENYRNIFRNYYNSPTDYDKEVLDCVAYMRENKCVYYTQPIINIGDKLPDSGLYKLNGNDVTTLYKEIGDAKYTIIGAFSNS